MKIGLYLLYIGCLFTYSSAWALSNIEQQFVKRMVNQHHFKEAEIKGYLKQAKYKQKIIDAITRPAEKTKEWFEYRPLFVTETRAKQGYQFWKENKATFDKAEQQFGVPAEIIAAIIGVETRYGRFTGGYRVLDALTTIGFHYKKRGEFFQSELEQFFLLCKEEGLNPTKPTGSYAGAMGMPQFIPSSFRNLAYDFDKDGKKDIWKNNQDVIGSVAHYFHYHQWHPGEPVAVKTALKSIDPSLAYTGRKAKKPHLSMRKLNSLNIKTPKILSLNDLATIIELKQKESADYWLGFHNFYVITRYNHSNLYAMSVFQLSQKIRALMDKNNQKIKK